MEAIYPMMVDLTSRRCLVVGGGKVATRKIKGLLEFNAEILVVSPTVTEQIHSWVQSGKIAWRSGLYQKKDGENCFIVVAATDDPEVNHQVYLDAKERGQWINVVDQPAYCNFHVPSIVRRGKLTLAISTQGASPSLTKQIRRELSNLYGEEYALFLSIAEEMRSYIQDRVPDRSKRESIFKMMINAKWIDACRTRPDQVRDEMLQWIDEEIKKPL
jgi:precorrin-2 dehydrogenase/sirohydrochlorin ferrochelatase